MFNSKFRLPAEAVPLVGKTLWNCEAGNIWFALGEPLHRPTRKMYQSRNEKTDKAKIFNTLITPTAINPPSSPMCQCAYISSYTYKYILSAQRSQAAWQDLVCPFTLTFSFWTSWTLWYYGFFALLGHSFVTIWGLQKCMKQVCNKQKNQVVLDFSTNYILL